MPYRHARALLASLSAAFFLAACGGDGGGGGSVPPAPTQYYTLGGSIAGLTGSVVLRNNGGNDLAVTANGGFVFAAPVPNGTDYHVTVATQPVNQTCVVSSGIGTVNNGNITSVAVNCTVNGGSGVTTYSVGGTVSGLVGSVKLRNNNADEITVSASGSFTFPVEVNHGGNYSVSVSAQPAGQTCTVTAGSGNNGNTSVAAITSVIVDCVSSTYTVGGLVSGLVGSVTLQSSSGESKTILSDGAFTFATPPLPYGNSWSVTVTTQPTGQTCSVVNGSGTVSGHVTNVEVLCVTNTYTVGGSITGLGGTLVLQNNLGDNLVRNDNGAFVFTTRIPYGGAYSVTVLSQPTGQTCTPGSASGIVTGAVTSITVNCVNNTYTLGGTVSGLIGSVDLKTDGGDYVTVSADGNFAFGTALANGTAYTVSVQANPPGQSCVVNNATGTVSGANVTSLAVVCATAAYRIGGIISGLAGTVVLQNNGGDNYPVSINGAFSMPTRATHGSNYAVTILTQPAGQSCAVSSGSGTATGNVTTIGISCTSQDYSVGGTVSGLTGGSVTLQNNGTGDIALAGDGSFTFGNSVAHAQPYEVTVLTQPAGQICVVDNSTGTINAANVTNVDVICVADTVTPTLPVLALGTITNPRELVFTWAAAAGATYYRLEKSVDGAPYVQAASDLTVTHATEVVPVHRHDWDNTFYRLQACNPNGCQVSSPLKTTTRMLQAIGYFKASIPDTGDSFGTSIALSADGGTLAVGAFCESSDLSSPADNSMTCAGAVYVFERDAGNGWSQVAFYKAPTPAADAFFGARVALAADGNTLAVAATGEGSSAGVVYVYPRTAGGWQPLQATIQGSNTGAQDMFGNWLALSADGDTLAVGAPGEASASGADPADNSAPGAGAAYVFTRSGSSWSEQAYLKAGSPDAADMFGISVALAADGNTLAVGGSGESSNATGIDGDEANDSAPRAGAAWLFVRSGTSWSRQAYLKAANAEAQDRFGTAVALAADGDTLAVGAHTESGGVAGINGDDADNSADSSGAVYLFTRSGTSWSQQAYIKASTPGASDLFGGALALAGDGNTLAVGSFNEDSTASGINGNEASDAASNAGAAWVFTFDGVAW
ncbi:MAG: beta strand repeat-containing protein, partial [Gammaproteobacteria bacterium]